MPINDRVLILNKYLQKYHNAMLRGFTITTVS